MVENRTVRRDSAFLVRHRMQDPEPADPPCVLRCQECSATTADVDPARWVAFLTSDEPPEVLFYCPVCAEREFGDS
jgi:hypothetical protein